MCQHTVPCWRDSQNTASGEAKKRVEKRTALRGKGVLDARFDLDRGKTGGIPAAAEGFDEKDAGDEFLALDRGHFAFVIEKIFLRVDHVEIADQAAGVAAVGNIESAAGGVDSLLLRLLRVVKNGKAGDAVLDFSEGVENRFAVAGDAGVVAGLRELRLSAA